MTCSGPSKMKVKLSVDEKTGQLDSNQNVECREEETDSCECTERLLDAKIMACLSSTNIQAVTRMRTCRAKRMRCIHPPVLEIGTALRLHSIAVGYRKEDVGGSEPPKPPLTTTLRHTHTTYSRAAIWMSVVPSGL
uniref:Uncharacterized protein n=1 Tax=Timema genevievae TaxID=629358 RepID=A0A7R9JT56_TIMGE|nr:unnamed protein product [Timema genevievae]